MRWPWSSSSTDKERDPSVSSKDFPIATDWSHYRDPRNIIPVVVLTGSAFVLSTFYRSYLKRIPQAINIEPEFWRKRSLFGKVTSVGDADNFRLFHTPGGRLAGWGLLPWRRVPGTAKELKEKTVRDESTRDVQTVNFDDSGVTHTDPYPTRWNRCSGNGTFRQPCSALFDRGLRLPDVICTAPSCSSVRAQARSVR